jgi:hypothetical protein
VYVHKSIASNINMAIQVDRQHADKKDSRKIALIQPKLEAYCRPRAENFETLSPPRLMRKIKIRSPVDKEIEYAARPHACL